MGVHHHAWSEARQDFEELELHVASHLENVARVDEEDVALVQLTECLERYLLHRALEQVETATQLSFGPARVGIDREQSPRPPFGGVGVKGVPDDERRETRPHLDHPGRPEMTDHRV